MKEVTTQAEAFSRSMGLGKVVNKDQMSRERTFINIGVEVPGGGALLFGNVIEVVSIV